MALKILSEILERRPISAQYENVNSRLLAVVRRQAVAGIAMPSSIDRKQTFTNIRIL